MRKNEPGCSTSRVSLNEGEAARAIVHRRRARLWWRRARPAAGGRHDAVEAHVEDELTVVIVAMRDRLDEQKAPRHLPEGLRLHRIAVVLAGDAREHAGALVAHLTQHGGDLGLGLGARVAGDG